MARIRSIKPEFWTDGDVMDMSPQARELFIGSWNFAMCDYGHLADDPRRLKMQVLPADDVMMVRDEAGAWTLQPMDPTVLVDELLASGRMVRLELDGRSYLHIVRFTDHQRLEKRWTPRCPACKALADHTEPLETSREPARPRGTSASDRTGQDRTTAAAAAVPTNHAAAAADDGALPATVDILRARLQEFTPLRALRFDTLTTDQVSRLEALIALHGDGMLVETAKRTCRPVPPVSVAAFLGTWEALPAPGQRLRAINGTTCGRAGHDHEPADRCRLCAADRLAGDA